VAVLASLGTVWACLVVVVLALCRAAAAGDRVEDRGGDLCGSPQSHSRQDRLANVNVEQ
jgi:hypothetical protein